MNSLENMKNNYHEDILPGAEFPELMANVEAPTQTVPFEDVLPFKIPGAMTPLTPEEQKTSDWELRVNGEKVENVSKAEFVNERLGIRSVLAKGEAGYPTNQITELGGSVTIPYMKRGDGKLYIGVVVEERPNMGGVVSNVPRGMFNHKHETGTENAVQEMAEETGLTYNNLDSRMVELATGVNANSAFLNTSQSAKQGANFYGLELKSSELELVMDDEGHDYYVFPKHIREQAKGDATGERILSSKFIPLEEAEGLKDGYTLIGAGLVSSRVYGNTVHAMSDSSRQQMREFNKRPDRALR
ncbi:MAG: hypothetical protein ABIR37_03475 [Candidatus Saccharimonadales bacterium]